MYNLWVTQYERMVQENTFVKTTRLFKNHILSSLDEYKINVDICQNMQMSGSVIYKKYKTVKAYASKVFDFALKRSYIQINPFLQFLSQPLFVVE